jgi:uncharacterized repeat protein (TIGR01451 family)
MYVENPNKKCIIGILVSSIISIGILIVFLVASGSGQDAISITVPTIDTNWNVDSITDDNIQQGILVVNSIQPWTVTVSSDLSDGLPAEYDRTTSQYVSGGSKLQNSMKIKAAGGNEVDLSVGGSLIWGAGGVGDVSIPVTFEQPITWQDRPLQNGHTYHIEVSFAGSVNTCSSPSIDNFEVTPPNGLVSPSSTATMSVDASGSDLSYQWLKYDRVNDIFLPLADGSHIFGANAAMLTISDFNCSDNGSYEVNVSNSCGFELQGATLEAYPIITQPGDEAMIYGYMNEEWVIDGGTADLSVGVDHPEAYSYQWQVQQPGSTWFDVTDNPSATTSNLRYQAFAQHDGNWFIVKITKGNCYWWSQPVVLKVGLIPLPDRHVLDGETVHFEMRPDDNIQYSYRWEFSNDELGGEWSTISGADSNELSFVAETEDDGKRYKVTVEERPAGHSETSNGATLRVGPIGPMDQETLEGDTVLFSVSPDDDASYSYVWNVSSDDGANWDPIGTDSSELTFPASAQDDGKKYKVTITSRETGISQTSRIATLSVSSPLTITTQPRSRTACLYGTASFSVDAAYNGELAYQWFKVTDHETIELADDDRISGATSKTLTINSIENTDAADYHVMVTGALGLAATSTDATLTVSSIPVIESTEVNPTNGEVAPGDTATLSVHASGSGLSYQWFKGRMGELCEFDESTTPLTDGGHISGANTDTLTISNFDCSDNKCYFVAVSNLCGFQVSVVHLGIWPWPPNTYIQPYPQHWALNGDSVTLRAEVAPSGDYSYQWQRSKNPERYLSEDIPEEENPTAITSSLSFTATTEDDGNYYHANITNGKCYWGTYATQLIVGLRGPDDQTILDWGDTVYFHVEPADKQRFSYQWQVSSDGGSEGGDTWNNVGTDNYDYTFLTTSADAGNMYRVIVTNKTSPLVTEESREAIIEPSIVGPEDQVVGVWCNAGTYVEFTVKPENSSEYTYLWGRCPPGVDNWDFTWWGPDQTFSRLGFWIDPSFNGWKYRVYVANKKTDLKILSEPAILTIFNTPCISSCLSSQEVCPGGTATFSVDATGDGVLAYQWYKVTPQGVTELIDGGHISNAKTRALTISQADSSDAADYFVNVMGLHNSVTTSYNVTLTVGPPSIIGPVDQTVCPGSLASFSVATEEHGYYCQPPLYKYQWQKAPVDLSFSDIDGETSSTYSFYAASSDNGNRYRCRVSNRTTDCSGDSNDATLTVTWQKDIRITMEDNPDPVRPDGDLDYTIGYINSGCQITNPVVEANFDTNIQFVSSDPAPVIEDNQYRWYLPDLEYGGFGTILIKVHVNPLASGSLSSTATISSDEGTLAQDSATTNVEGDAPLLYIEKDQSSQVIWPGADPLEYTINCENRAGSTLTNVTVNDTIDKNLKFLASSPSPTRMRIDEDGTHLWWSAAVLSTQSMPPGGSRQMKLWVYMPWESEPQVDSVYNRYNISSNEIMVKKGTYNILQTFVVHSLYVRKKAEKDIYRAGDTINYTINYGNNDGKVVFDKVFIKDVLPDLNYVDYLGASRQPDNISGNVLLWNIGTLHPGDSGTIQLYVKIKENLSEMNFKSSGSVSGVGFANIRQNLDTAQKPDHLTNYVYINDMEIDKSDSSSATIMLADALGTAVDITGHGSGSYRRQDEAQVLMKNRSIQVKTSLSEVYSPTSFALPKGRILNYNSKWSEAQSSKNRITGATLSEVYMYANRIKRDSTVSLDKNGSTLASETSFEGAGHIGVLKKPDTVEKFKGTPTYESREDYLGNFTIRTNVDEYGKNLATNRTVSGTGMASSDRRISNKQRSYESGTGAYLAEEKTDTLSNYMAKNLNAVHEPVSYAYTPDVRLSLSQKWRTGMWTRSGSLSPKGSNSSVPASFISEEFSDANFLNVSTVAPGLNEMNTEAEFSGRAEFKAAKEDDNSSGEKVALYDEYIGRYRLSRKMMISGVARFDMPHLSIAKVGRVEPPASITSSYAGNSTVSYTITVENDGNRALGPVYVTDLFPPETEYISSSAKPAELGGDHARWTLISLGIGASIQIELKLKAKEGVEGLVNRVQADGAYTDQWVSAQNFSAIQINFQSCCPSQMLVTKQGNVDPSDAKLIRYNITLQNRREETIVATIDDQLPQGLEFIGSSVSPSNVSSTSNTVRWDLIEIRPGENRTIDYRCRALWGGMFENLAHVDAYSLDGADLTSTDVISSVFVEGEGYRSSSTWQPPACFGLNCTQQGFEKDWMACVSCGAQETETASQVDQTCPACSGGSRDGEGYEIP